MPANSILDGPVANLTFNTVHFGRNPFTCSCKGRGGGGGGLNDFKFGTVTGHFPSYGVASMAVKRLKNWDTDSFWDEKQTQK